MVSSLRFFFFFFMLVDFGADISWSFWSEALDIFLFFWDTEGDDKGDQFLSLLMLLGSDRSARRSDLAEEEEAARRGGDAGREDPPAVCSFADESSTPECFRFFLRFASLLLVPLVSLAEEDDGPPPRPLDGRGELSIADCLQHDKMRRLPISSNARPLYIPTLPK